MSPLPLSYEELQEENRRLRKALDEAYSKFVQSIQLQNKRVELIERRYRHLTTLSNICSWLVYIIALAAMWWYNR